MLLVTFTSYAGHFSLFFWDREHFPSAAYSGLTQLPFVKISQICPVPGHHSFGVWVILCILPEIPFKGARVAKGNCGSKEKGLKTFTVTHVLPRGNILNNRKSAIKVPWLTRSIPFQNTCPFIQRQILLKHSLLSVVLLLSYTSLLKPRSKYLLLPLSRKYTPTSLYSCKVLINPQNCNSHPKIANYGALL